MRMRDRGYYLPQMLVVVLVLLSLPGSPQESQVSDSAHAPLRLNAGLVVHWPLDESAGDIAFDVSGHHLDGGIQGGKWIEGVVGSALKLDGTNDFVFLSHDAALDITDSISIALWIYVTSDPDTTEDSDYRILMGRWSFPDPYGLILEESRFINGSVFIDGARQRLRSRAPTPIGQWRHVAFTYNTMTGEGRLFINGELRSSIKGVQGTIDTSDDQLRITRANPPNSHRAFPGRIDDVRIYNRELTSREVAELAKATQDR